MATVEDFTQEWLSDSTVIKAHTSGSTGKPKDILLNKADMRASARATNAYFGIEASSVLASPLSVDYIAGKMMVVRACEAGCRLIELPVSNEIKIPCGIDRIDLLPIVPSQINSLLEQAHLSGVIRNVLIGGAPPSAEDCHRLTLAGYKAFISYGMTETCSHVALARADEPRRIFHAMPGVSFDVDPDNRLIINASGFTFKSLLTNDVVTLLSPTAMEWRGRADGIINTGGLKLLPEELETLYSEVLSGREYYVKGVDDRQWGTAVAMVIVARESEKEELQRRLRTSIADHRLLPKYIIAVDNLPRTSNGKIKRH